MIVRQVSHGDLTWTIYVLEDIVVYVEMREMKLIKVQFSREVEFVLRENPKIYFRRGRARLHGITLTDLEQCTGMRYAMLDTELRDISKDLAYIADNHILVKFYASCIHPTVVQTRRPIVLIADHVLDHIQITAHNVFDALVIQHHNAYLGYVKISDLLDTEVYVVEHHKMAAINDKLRVFINEQNDLCTDRGDRYKLRNIRECASWRVEMPSQNELIAMSLSPRAISYVNVRHTDGYLTHHNASWMFSKMQGTLQVVYIKDFEIVICNSMLMYCQRRDENHQITIHDGILTMVGNSIRLLEGLMQSMNYANITKRSKYFYVHTNLTSLIYERLKCSETVYLVGNETVVSISNADGSISIPKPVAHAQVSYESIGPISQISEVFHLIDGTIVFSADDSVFRTCESYDTVVHNDDFTVQLNGENFYYGRGFTHAINGRRVQLRTFQAHEHLQWKSERDNYCVILNRHTKVMFSTINKTNAQYTCVIQTRDERFIAIVCNCPQPGAQLIHVGYEVCDPPMHTKVAPRDID